LKPLVYLAGPIHGLEYDAATDWRFQTSAALRDRGIESLNPMRAKLNIAERGRISNDFRDYAGLGSMFTSRGIISRDFNDVKRCDAILVNLLDTPQAPTGSTMEIAWAYAFQKPVVAAIADDHKLLLHPMFVEALPYRVLNLEEAIDTVAVLLNR
jgi:nucleoside 2-deoxyribosyltransferase